MSCAAGGVQSVAIRLGDGDDSANAAYMDIPATAYGEAGGDHLTVSARPGNLADGGDGDDNLDQGDDLRGGPGNDRLTGSRLLDGGDGYDVLRKTGGTAAGRLAGGSGDDALESDDGWPDDLQCGAGTDVITNADAKTAMTAPVRAGRASVAAEAQPRRRSPSSSFPREGRGPAATAVSRCGCGAACRRAM